MSVTCLITGTGRDGTTTARVLACNLAIENDDTPDALHETDISRLYNSWLPYHQTGDSSSIERILRGWTHRTESSSGHAFWLPVIAEVFGRDLRLIHLIRDEQSCVRSLCLNRSTWPEYHGNYVYDYHGEMKTFLPAAFHFGEMSEAQWKKIDLEERVTWYYRKTHSLIEENKHLFARYLRVRTGDLDSPEVVTRIREMVNPEWPVDVTPVHQNYAGFHHYHSLTREERRRAETFLNDLDVLQLIRSPTGILYGASFFMGKVLSTYRGDPEARDFLIYTRRRLGEALGRDGEGEDHAGIGS